ncbi:MAG: sigma-70 family RNA polymerase sigma factor [Proteobacteria bacterium]|nr:sigma-70 family RNA polymerase sigma factor [Pseudomonadota bacterium]
MDKQSVRVTLLAMASDLVASDSELFDSWCCGDTEAGNQLIQRHFDSVYRFFETKAAGDVDELVQCTFLSCVQARDQFAKRSSFRTYLFAIARHQLYRNWRRQRRGREVLDFGSISVEAMVTTPTGQIARNQDQRRLLRALCSLPLDQQMLLELHYWEDMEIGELAEIFEIAAGAMRARLFRARRALRKRMETLADAPDLSHASVEDFETWARSMRRKRPAVKAASAAE